MNEFTYYKGWKIVWTGWKTFPNQIELVGQWIAIPEEDPSEPRLYVAIPGAMGRLPRCHCMDLSHFAHQCWLDCNSSDMELEYARHGALIEMFKLVDAAMNGDVDRYVEDRLYPGRCNYVSNL